jgi:flagellar basal body-associated protein FliL
VTYLPLIVVEVLLVFGGAVAFAWWQFKDLARERKKREDAKQNRSSE